MNGIRQSKLLEYYERLCNWKIDKSLMNVKWCLIKATNNNPKENISDLKEAIGGWSAISGGRYDKFGVRVNCESYGFGAKSISIWVTSERVYYVENINPPS